MPAPGRFPAQARSCDGRSFTQRGPGSSGPVRSFGPARSIATKQVRPVASAACLTCCAMERHASASSCAQLMRAMFTPRSTNSRTKSGSVAVEEGSVTMMRVTRSTGSGPNSCCVRWWSSSGPSSTLAPVSAGCCQVSPSMAQIADLTKSRVASTWGSLRPNEDSP